MKLYEALKDNDYLQLTNELTEAIYYHENIGYIWGEFDCGMRGLDHNTLLYDDITYIDLMNEGILIVPETETYVSDEPHTPLDLIGYERLPKNSNHFVGF